MTVDPTALRQSDDVLLADLRRIAATVDPTPYVVKAPLPWSGGDPLADMRAMVARLATVPFHRFEPLIMSPRQYERYQQEMARLDALNRLDVFRREIAWRRIRARRLTPMYTAYRHRTRRRNRRG